jgi:hypothetical protein
LHNNLELDLVKGALSFLNKRIASCKKVILQLKNMQIYKVGIQKSLADELAGGEAKMEKDNLRKLK